MRYLSPEWRRMFDRLLSKSEKVFPYDPPLKRSIPSPRIPNGLQKGKELRSEEVVYRVFNLLDMTEVERDTLVSALEILSFPEIFNTPAKRYPEKEENARDLLKIVDQKVYKKLALSVSTEEEFEDEEDDGDDEDDGDPRPKAAQPHYRAPKGLSGDNVFKRSQSSR